MLLFIVKQTRHSQTFYALRLMLCVKAVVGIGSFRQN